MAPFLLSEPWLLSSLFEPIAGEALRRSHTVLWWQSEFYSAHPWPFPTEQPFTAPCPFFPVVFSPWSSPRGLSQSLVCSLLPSCATCSFLETFHSSIALVAFLASHFVLVSFMSICLTRHLFAPMSRFTVSVPLHPSFLRFLGTCPLPACFCPFLFVFVVSASESNALAIQSPCLVVFSLSPCPFIPLSRVASLLIYPVSTVP